MNYYFIGAGGIGMANLVRYCLAQGSKAAGYDRAQSDLTDTLVREGAPIIYSDDPELIPGAFRDPATTTVVYTPAVPEDTAIVQYFRQGGFRMIKRAAALGDITRSLRGICVAGSHGKTTTCSMIANIMRGAEPGCNAFLGGILRNINSNFLLDRDSDIAVIEADEYDRSFHRLSPWLAVITSTDPDHLDIYGDARHYEEAFEIFTSLIKPGGHLLLHSGLRLHPRTAEGVDVMRYRGMENGSAEGLKAACGSDKEVGKEDAEEPDWRADNIRFDDGRLYFDLVGNARAAASLPKGKENGVTSDSKNEEGVLIEGIELGSPALINVENGVAAAAAALIAGCSADDVRRGLGTFMGARRRFEIYLRPGEGRAVLIDDYAHSPNEIRASIASVRRLFPGRHLSVVFQPHLYTRTRDFAPEFADALSGADRVWLPEIYPAREFPIEGVDSDLICRQIKVADKKVISRKNLLKLIENTNFDILMTLGAADIDRLLPAIATELRKTCDAEGKTPEQGC